VLKNVLVRHWRILVSREYESIINPSGAAYLIDKVLLSLENDEWHDLAKIENKAQLSTYKVKVILSFLSEYKFIEFDAEGRKVRIDPATKRWLQSLRHVEI
jgi:hypothetical protein